MPHFECGAFDHSATSPGAIRGDSSPAVGRVLGEDGETDKAAGYKISAGSKPQKGAAYGAFDGPGR
jgi:hypothetical protein